MTNFKKRQGLSLLSDRFSLLLEEKYGKDYLKNPVEAPILNEFFGIYGLGKFYSNNKGIAYKNHKGKAVQVIYKNDKNRDDYNDLRSRLSINTPVGIFNHIIPDVNENLYDDLISQGFVPQEEGMNQQQMLMMGGALLFFILLIK